MNFLKKKDEQKDTASSVGKRRKFLSGAAGAGAVALGFPMIARPSHAGFNAVAEHVAGEGHLSRIRQ